MGGPFREHAPADLDVDARESDAVRALGRWRDRTKTIVLTLFGIGGIALFVLGYDLVESLQFRASGGVASMRVNVLGGCAAWALAFAVGWIVARVLIARRTPAMLDVLAARYQVPRERLQEIADLVKTL